MSLLSFVVLSLGLRFFINSFAIPKKLREFRYSSSTFITFNSSPILFSFLIMMLHSFCLVSVFYRHLVVLIEPFILFPLRFKSNRFFCYCFSNHFYVLPFLLKVLKLFYCVQLRYQCLFVISYNFFIFHVLNIQSCFSFRLSNPVSW